MPTGERQCVAWLALDSAESEPLRLLQYMIAALRQAEPTLGTATLAFLETSQPALELALMLLVNDLAALSEPVVLILDDYHLLRAPALHQILRFLVDQLPPQLHLVIATRESLPLPLNRLRARGQLHEIRATDLRFTSDESAHMLQALGLTLDAQAIAALEQRLEGWAAGLQLTALTLREQNDQNRFITSFVGSHRLALDYLAEEVLTQLPDHILTFLLQTSILNRLCGPLCDAVVGLVEPGSGETQPLPNDAYSQLLLIETVPEPVRVMYPRLLMLQGLCAARNYHIVPTTTLFMQAAAIFAAQGDLAGWGEALLRAGNEGAAHDVFAEALDDQVQRQVVLAAEVRSS